MTSLLQLLMGVCHFAAWCRVANNKNKNQVTQSLGSSTPNASLEEAGLPPWHAEASVPQQQAANSSTLSTTSTATTSTFSTRLLDSTSIQPTLQDSAVEPKTGTCRLIAHHSALNRPPKSTAKSTVPLRSHSTSTASTTLAAADYSDLLHRGPAATADNDTLSVSNTTETTTTTLSLHLACNT